MGCGKALADLCARVRCEAEKFGKVVVEIAILKSSWCTGARRKYVACSPISRTPLMMAVCWASYWLSRLWRRLPFLPLPTSITSLTIFGGIAPDYIDGLLLELHHDPSGQIRSLKAKKEDASETRFSRPREDLHPAIKGTFGPNDSRWRRTAGTVSDKAHDVWIACI